MAAAIDWFSRERGRPARMSGNAGVPPACPGTRASRPHDESKGSDTLFWDDRNGSPGSLPRDRSRGEGVETGHPRKLPSIVARWMHLVASRRGRGPSALKGSVPEIAARARPSKHPRQGRSSRAASGSGQTRGPSRRIRVQLFRRRLAVKTTSPTPPPRHSRIRLEGSGTEVEAWTTSVPVMVKV